MADHTPAPSTPRRGPVALLWHILHSKTVGQGVVIVFLVAMAYLFGVKGMRFFLVPSHSMEPTLHIGDQVVTLRQAEYRHGDLVVVWDGVNREHIVKRLVGRPGDRIEVYDGALFINGGYASEPYIAEPMNYAIPMPVTVPEGEIFLLGDNRNDSDDSHSEGRTFPEDGIVGRVRMIYFPYDRFGSLPRFPLERLLTLSQSAED